MEISRVVSAFFVPSAVVIRVIKIIYIKVIPVCFLSLLKRLCLFPLLGMGCVGKQVAFKTNSKIESPSELSS